MPSDPHTRRPPLVDVRTGEAWPLAWGAGSFFCVLASYYVLRPVREAYGAGFSSAELAWSFVWTLAAMVVATPIYSLVVAALPRRRLLTVVDGFFVLNLLGLWWGLAHAGDPAPLALKRVFFVWLSVFNLYVVTLFWSVAVDSFTSAQGKRLFGVIAAAGTTGGIVGSLLCDAFVRFGRPHDVLLASAALLVGSIACGNRLRRAANASPDEGDLPDESVPAEDPFSAFRGAIDVARSPFLAAIGVTIVLACVNATGVYVQMLELVRQQLPDEAERRQWFSALNLYQNGLTLLGQFVGVSWLMRTAGVGATLAVAPIVYLAGFAVLGLGYSELWLLGAFDVLQRCVSFAFAGPAREVLFTTVAPDEKYRAKAFADTVLKRVGDAIAAWCGQLSTATGYARWMLPVAGASILLASWLGRAHKAREAQH
ncbi:MAG: hypothetical protein KF688_18860 [Pirellulales bacterium]|nr:hypothetical protein [Pirellulales bacterium]